MNYKTLQNLKIYDEDIKTVTFYLISLYYKTGCKYYCYRTKLNRLLTIYKFCAMKYNDECLKNDFFINDNHMGFPVLRAIVDRDVYLKLEWDVIKENNQEIKDEFDETIDFYQEYKCAGKKLSTHSKTLIENIFRKFGNYTIHDLAYMLDEIKDTIPIIKRSNDEYKINTENFQEFLNTNMNNEVFEFIKNFEKEQIKNVVKVKVYKKSKNILENKPF